MPAFTSKLSDIAWKSFRILFGQIDQIVIDTKMCVNKFFCF